MADKRDHDMTDPRQQILKSLAERPDDAQTMAEFLDIQVVIEIFREQGYNAREKIRTLIEIWKTGSNSQKMQAMDRLDQIWLDVLTRRGILTNKGTPAPMAALPTDPRGLPGTLKTFEAEQTTSRVRATMELMGSEITPESNQPLHKELTDGQEEIREALDEDEQYYNDDRGTDPNIFREATVDHGQQTPIK